MLTAPDATIVDVMLQEQATASCTLLACELVDTAVENVPIVSLQSLDDDVHARISSSHDMFFSSPRSVSCTSIGDQRIPPQNAPPSSPNQGRHYDCHLQDNRSDGENNSRGYTAATIVPLASALLTPRTLSSARAPGAPLRIAIVLNSYRSRLLPAIRASYQRTIGAVAPDAQLAFYEPANRPGDFPDPAFFDLVVLGGGNVDPRRRHPWILSVHDFVRKTVRDMPRIGTKLLGICWGHQTLCLLFGGEVGDAGIPQMGVATIHLTAQGQQFFSSSSSSSPSTITPEENILKNFKLQQHHRREVLTAPPSFTPLAEENQILVSPDNGILTFQGHPEKDAQTARLRLHDSVRWFGFDALSDEKAYARLEALIDADHDGEIVWSRVLRWVREPVTPGGEALLAKVDDDGEKVDCKI